MSGAPVVSMTSEGKTCYVYPRNVVGLSMTNGFVAHVWRCVACDEKCWPRTYDRISECEECGGKLVRCGTGRWTSPNTFTMD
jgi:hypothetical protein